LLRLGNHSCLLLPDRDAPHSNYRQRVHQVGQDATKITAISNLLILTEVS
jgi:hypothetical protein